MADLAAIKFTADLTKFSRQLDIDLKTIMRKIAIDLWTKIVRRTPVDTGRARAGWGLAIGSPEVETPPEGIHGAPSTPDVSGITGKQPVYIINNVEYIEALEDGHSGQAPAGMVRISILEIQVELETIAA